MSTPKTPLLSNFSFPERNSFSDIKGTVTAPRALAKEVSLELSCFKFNIE